MEPIAASYGAEGGGHDATPGLEPYTPPPEASDQTIRVLELPRVQAWSYRGLSPSSDAGREARKRMFGGHCPALYEPDHVRWPGRDGMERALLRGGIGQWGGYVLIPEGHVLYSAELPLEALDVHGGITFRRRGTSKATGLTVLVLGFDTITGPDLMEGLPYRDVWYAASELLKLANQLATMARVVERELGPREASP